DVLPDRASTQLTLTAVRRSFEEIAMARGTAPKAHLLRELLEYASPLEAKYIVKIITGDLRIGLKESLVEEAIARGYEAPLADVQRANMLLGDIGETLVLASEGRLGDAQMRLFHPIDFMLASPVESAEEALGYFDDASVEDKYDGIRAQAHIDKGEVRFYSRTRDEITESFPELLPALASLPDGTILDGEIVAWQVAPASRRQTDPPADAIDSGSHSAAGRALPFSILQQRLGRKKVSEPLMRDVPVAYLAFDVICHGGELLLDRPLRERAQILDKLLPAPLF